MFARLSLLFYVKHQDGRMSFMQKDRVGGILKVVQLLKTIKHMKHAFKKYSWLIGLLLLALSASVHAQVFNPNHTIGTVSGNYSFAYNQTPDQLVEIYPAAFPNTGLAYQWESSSTPMASDFTPISGATAATYSFPPPPTFLTQTTYYRRKTINTSTSYIYSNIIKINIVSVNWEDLNYLREHQIMTTGQTTWTQIDQLAIGQKMQITTYFDGIGRPLEEVSREAATSQGTLWGDIVNFHKYDQSTGNEPFKYVSYVTTTTSGKYKGLTNAQSEQTQYVLNTYNETSAFVSLNFDNSPLNRVINEKKPGTQWANGSGSSISYDVNTVDDNVQRFVADYIQGNAPTDNGAYPPASLLKMIYTDENGKIVVDYKDNEGHLILRKTQIEDIPSAAHNGWICTYNVYDDFGYLRFVIQPEAVKYLDANGWSFSNTDGQQVFQELCFQYFYDTKGRLIWKKSPGVKPLNTLYDVRDRIVFTQDGNQSMQSTPQWTTNLYDELDRPLLTTLYSTTKTITALQSDIDNASSGSVTFNMGSSATLTTNLNPVLSLNLNSETVFTNLKCLFYDDYSFASVKSFNTGYSNLNAYNPSDNNVIPIANSQRTIGAITGSITRILGTTTFLNSTHYYDDKGNHIQILEDNIKNGVDISTSQYHFDGRLLSFCSDHTSPGTGYTNYQILTSYIFDKIGRVTSLKKQFGANASKIIATYDYDDMGRIKVKHLDPNYSNVTTGGTELESLNYSYNVNNQITGINKDFALKSAGYSKWSHYFGLYIGFDNKDNVFGASKLNGQVTGLLWNTMGDDAQRKYDYVYDNAGRLINAAFTEQQHPGDGYAKTKMDFSVAGSGGKITYDLNSNILTMQQKSVLPGTSAPITVDDLVYSYHLSNKLTSVTDIMNTPTVNGSQGDFKDGANGSSPDYVYDNNGNLLVDLNKNIQSLNGTAPSTDGVSYNYLDKPEQIRIVGKGTIKIIYRADGKKLQRIYTPESGTSVTTTYINEFVYQAVGEGTDVLSFINFEEGRLRIMTPTNVGDGVNGMSEDGNIAMPNSKMGAWDYYLLDYQQNVRMILTEETHSATNTCTMEAGSSAIEDPVFGQTGSSNEVEITRSNKPTAWTGTGLGNSVSLLGNLVGHNIGPNTLQKVMAGDVINASAQYYYDTDATGATNDILTTVLSSLVGEINGGGATSSLIKSASPGISSQLGALAGFQEAVNPTGSGGSTPQAYLTMIFFDERFNFISAVDGGVVQQQVAASVPASGLPLGVQSKAPKNGYVFVYLSNKSDKNVYFDNFKVIATAGNIIEENHYYAYGLKIAAISSKKLADNGEGKIANPYQYNDKEMLDEDMNLNWSDYGYRNYDCQIGRFVQLDPLADFYPFLTSFQYASCEPITNVDIDGLEKGGAVGGIAAATSDFTMAYNETKALSLFNPIYKTISTTATVGKTTIEGIQHVYSITSLVVNSAVNCGNLINVNITSHIAKATGRFLSHLYFDYGGTDFRWLGGNLREFHNNDADYRNLGTRSIISFLDIGIGNKSGRFDEPAANARIGYVINPDNNNCWRVGLTWYHLKPNPYEDVYLGNGYTQVGPFAGKTFTRKRVSLNTNFAVGGMASQPQLVNNAAGTLRGFDNDGHYRFVGIGVTIDCAVSYRITKWLSIFYAVIYHASQTVPMEIVGGSSPGPGRLNTQAGSTSFGISIWPGKK
jgi:RHS repeat-associated protein